MIFAVLVGIIMGFVLAIPPGPVSVSAAKLSVFSTKKSTLLFIYASSTVDFLSALSTIFAAAAISKAISSFAQTHILITNIVQISVVVAFILFGIFSLTRSKKYNIQDFGTTPKLHFLDKISHKGPFFFGLAIALSNLANPTFLPSLGYISLQVESMNFFTLDFFNKVLFSFGFGFGNFLWLYTMTLIIALNKHRITESFQKRLQQFVGITFISFGTLLGYRLFQIIHWQDIIRIIFAI
jgi:threonine/homoserine/homoserine lactone efflux protein